MADYVIEKEKGWKCGFFKLGSSEESTPSEALSKYRKRVTIEHLILSLKRVTGIKPLRAWKNPSVRGAMMPVLLSESDIGMAKFEMKERTEHKAIDGKNTLIRAKLSVGYIVRSLNRLTFTKAVEGKHGGKTFLSNREPLSTEISGNIRHSGSFTV